MSRWFAKLFLWINGYCTRHGCHKTLTGFDPESATYECDECEKEHDRKRQSRISAARRILGFEQEEPNNG